MTLQYTITREQYIEVIEYQMKLNLNTRGKIVRYVAGNAVFCIMALYFAVARTEYAWYTRFAPLAMAALLLLLSTLRRTGIAKKAARSFDSYQKQGQLAEGFIGEHTLIVKSGKLTLSAGKSSRSVPCREFARFIPLKSCVLLIAGGTIFDLIPSEAWSEEVKTQLLQAVERETGLQKESDRAEIPEGAYGVLRWQIEEEEYTRGLTEGRRAYYFTRAAYTPRQIMSLVILVYGVVLLGLHSNLYLGIGFTLIGILLNRRMFTAFSPFGYAMSRRQVLQAKGLSSECGEAMLYLEDRTLYNLVMGQRQSCGKDEIIDIRSRAGFTFLYSVTGQMYVIPQRVFASAEELQFFLRHFSAAKRFGRKLGSPLGR